MNRCLIQSSSQGAAALLALAASLAFASPLPAAAQVAEPQRIPPITASAKPGVLRVTTPPDVLVDGRPARLAPGARIRDRNNLLVVSGALIGQDLPVRYTRDPFGLVHEVWVLTAAEVVAGTTPPPSPARY